MLIINIEIHFLAAYCGTFMGLLKVDDNDASPFSTTQQAFSTAFLEPLVLASFTKGRRD